MQADHRRTHGQRPLESKTHGAMIVDLGENMPPALIQKSDGSTLVHHPRLGGVVLPQGHLSFRSMPLCGRKRTKTPFRTNQSRRPENGLRLRRRRPSCQFWVDSTRRQENVDAQGQSRSNSQTCWRRRSSLSASVTIAEKNPICLKIKRRSRRKDRRQRRSFSTI
ncbi:MAG: hypothetical protein MZU97_00725 [Bacillus subtilis]|nr:hypothetical protein [Bacillus subtilis]